MNEVIAVAIVLLVGALVLVFQNRSRNLLEGQRFSAIVSYVYDGDTVQIRQGKRRIRLWGIDTPEKGEPGADAARTALVKLIDGKRIEVLPIDTDRYGRTVARIFRGGQDISAIMIERDHAKEYCLFSKGFYGRC